MERATDYFVTGASLPLQPPAGHADVNAISCERPQLTFGDNDFRAPLDLDLPMYVQSGGRAVAIELVGGSFRVRVVQGNLTESEWAELRSALQRANTLLKASSG